MAAGGDILTVNMGSSSLKFSLWDGSGAEVARGVVERIGDAPRLKLSSGEERDWGRRGATPPTEDLLRDVLALLEERRGGAGYLTVVGHRVVHGGRAFVGPVLVDDDVLGRLAALSPLAPLHQPHGLAGIRACRALLPGVPQVAVFDTAFHHALPVEAARFAVPRELEDAGVRRYGFHGLSFAHVARHLAEAEPALRRVIVAHLGNGASLCALADGRSVDTTMGFTPLDGLVMGTRPGLLDPGIVLWLLRERGLDAAAIEDLLYHRCGLLGASGGIASDMRALEASGDPRAAGAISLFTHRVAREIGALCASLGGLDGLVFTGGIGERSPRARAGIVGRCGWLGAALDAGANERGLVGRISAGDSAVPVLIVPTDEEHEIARAARSVIGPVRPVRPSDRAPGSQSAGDACAPAPSSA